MTPKEALTRAQAQCAAAEQCPQKVREKLLRWGLTREEAGEVIEALLRDDYLNEARYAVAYARDRSRFARWGARKIAYHLRMQGVSDEVARAAVASIDEEGERAQLQSLLEDKARKTHAKTAYELRQKLVRFAMGRGYDLDDILKCITFVDE